ncbi:MAG: hypothetical protein IJP96_07205 [Synergistaceae bacterium]|nr:hypothetical protein [Synergistaceae bacterium]
MLLELLQNELPRSICKLKAPEVFKIVKRHLNEIEEARTKGYSWFQIECAFRQAYPEVDYFGGFTQTYYKRIKMEDICNGKHN